MIHRSELLNLLKHLDANVPHDEGTHIAITAGQYGSSEAGWEDRLLLSIRQHGETRVLFLEESDLEKGPDVLVREIHAEMSRSYSTLYTMPFEDSEAKK
jgi:hypothetical protein